MSNDIACTDCGLVLPHTIEHFALRKKWLKRQCRKCETAKAAQWKRDNRARANENNRISRRRVNYGLEPEQLAEILAAQGGVCAICSTDTPGGSGGWHVDHDHACCPGQKSCGKCIRGLLCVNCNLGIGQLKDTPALLRKAADYLEAHSVVTV